MANQTYLSLVNSFRSGVTSNHFNLRLLTGRDLEMKEIERCLEDAKKGIGSIKLISGEYGSGKSLLLKSTKAMALELNYVVANLSISNGFRLNHLDDFYYQVMHNLEIKGCIPGSKSSFEDIFESWLNKLKSLSTKNDAQIEITNVIHELSKYNQSMARALLTYIKAKINNEREITGAVSSWLMGEQNIPAHVKAKFDIKGSIDKHNSIDFFKAFSKLVELLGFAGILINIDEVGLLLQERSDTRRRSYENLRYIIDNLFEGSFINCFFLLASTPDIIDDEEKGFYSAPALYSRLGNIGKTRGTFNDLRQTVIYLRPLNRDSLLTLCEKITEIHQKAFNWKTSISINALNNWVLFSLCNGDLENLYINNRAYVIKLVEILDVMEQNRKFNVYNSELKIIKRDGKEIFVNSMAT